MSDGKKSSSTNQQTGTSSFFAGKGFPARKILFRAVEKFLLVEGDQRAAAFAYYAFFSLFPLILIFVTVGSLFVDRDHVAKEVISYVEGYVPLGAQMKRNVFDIISGVVLSRGRMGVVAFMVLFWSALGFFNTLVHAVNRAWESETHEWWQLPFKSSLLLAVMASALMLGISLPVLAEVARNWMLPDSKWMDWIYRLTIQILPVLVLFYGLSLFYKLAPRHFTRFAEVWPVALLVSVLLRILGSFFAFYLLNFAHFNAVYGALGSIMALLLWIYLSGSLIIFGACLCAGYAEVARASGLFGSSPR